MKNSSARILFVIFISLLGNEKSFSQNSLKPNILLVIVDDGRYRDYAATGGPSWFLTPTINRIADEGANFTNDYVVLSLCEPSRVSIFTGKYPHHNGFIYNTQTYDTATLTIARILRENGYYTGLVGKFINSFNAFPSSDFNYYCAYDGQGNYAPKVFDLNGTDTLLNENVSVAINDFAIHFLQSVPPDKPFFLMLTPKAPHPAYVAYPGYANAYHSETVAFPSNFSGYTKNYPSYIYFDNLYQSDSAGCVDDIQTYYEDLIGAEAGLDSVFTILENQNILDSTLIIFTSDNGVFIGEHHMQKKRLAYEESMHVPLFVRYPEWFAPHTVVSNEMSLNIDLFATLLDAASVTDTFNDDGISLRELATGQQHRKEFLFEYFRDSIQPGIPDFRAVRSLEYKYIRSSCDQTTEEFYDLVNDPKEDTNQIFNPVYASLIETYRSKLDSLRMILGDDPGNDTVIACSLLNPDTTFTSSPVANENISFTVSPDPVSEILSVYLPSSISGYVEITITDMEGKVLEEKRIHFSFNQKNKTVQLPVNQLPAGIYVVKVGNGTLAQSKLIVKE